MRIIAVRASAAGSTGFGRVPAEALDNLAEALGRIPEWAEVTIDPIVTDPEPTSILMEEIRHVGANPRVFR